MKDKLFIMSTNENIQLKHEIMALKIENYNLQQFIQQLFNKCIPLAKQIQTAKGFFRLFKIFKLAIVLAGILLEFFNHKPEEKKLI
nr:hypothetical protein [Nanoarchaeota archaeon]